MVEKIKPPISVIIPVKNRDLERVQKCIESVRQNCFNLVQEIIVVDYNSKEEVKLDNCRVMRINDLPFWNKAHAINLAVITTKTPYIMTIDCDILLSKEHFTEIINNLNKKNLILSTNVRRLKREDLSDNYSESLIKSLPWYGENRTQLHNEVNGGIQVYPRSFFDLIGGLCESIGKWWGGLDNWVYFVARMNNYTIIDISYPLIHLEHPNEKEDNMLWNDKLKEIAKSYREWKASWLDKMVENRTNINPESFYGREEPCDEIFHLFLNYYFGVDKL